MEQLHLGVARKVITPEVGGQLAGYRPDLFSESVADDLTVTAFFFRHGNNRALMISATVCCIQTALAQTILSTIEQRFHIPKSHCMLSATHTHSGPNLMGQSGWGDLDSKYCEEIFVPAILEVTDEAIGRCQPVKMGVASGVSLAGVNRREVNEKNEIVFGQNPWGCFNPKMTVISFVDKMGLPVANIVHYGAHCTAAGANREITRDWAGVMVDALEKQSGATTAFFNGTLGDAGPRLSSGRTVGDMSYVHEMGAVAAQDAVEIYKKIADYTEVALAVSEKELHIPLKARMECNQAKEMLEDYIGETVNVGGLIKTYLQDVIASYENEYEEKESFSFSQTVLSLGDVVFASFPYEPFSEVGLRIEKAIPSKTVLSLSLTNGSEGYFITQDAICRGGYEVDMFLYGHIQAFCDDADFYLMRETVQHIKDHKI